MQNNFINIHWMKSGLETAILAKSTMKPASLTSKI